MGSEEGDMDEVDPHKPSTTSRSKDLPEIRSFCRGFRVRMGDT